MFNSILLRLFQFREACQSVGMKSAIKKLIIWKREIYPVLKELDEVTPMDAQRFIGLQLIEITKQNYDPHRYFLPFKSRKYKLQKYLKDGYRAFAAISGKEIAGEVWYTTSGSDYKIISDLKLLNIRLAEDEVYMFDMFVSPHQRSRHVNDFLVNRSLMALKRKGYQRVYGYFDSDNIPALWFHRKHKYTELEKLDVTQFFLMKRVRRNRYCKIEKPT